MYTISKTFMFEAAHRLVHGYEGKCAHVHGHSWEVTVFLERGFLNARGMVRDFGDVKVLREWVDDNLDHATLVSAADKYFINWLEANHQRHFVIPTNGIELEPNPTSEVLCRFLFFKAKELGLKEISALEIKETCTSNARYDQDV